MAMDLVGTQGGAMVTPPPRNRSTDFLDSARKRIAAGDRVVAARDDGTRTLMVAAGGGHATGGAIDGALDRFGADSGCADARSGHGEATLASLAGGLGALIDADLAEEAARLRALQTRQQLAAQTLSIANRAPHSLLSLFRGGQCGLRVGLNTPTPTLPWHSAGEGVPAAPLGPLPRLRRGLGHEADQRRAADQPGRGCSCPNATRSSAGNAAAAGRRGTR